MSQQIEQFGDSNSRLVQRLRNGYYSAFIDQSVNSSAAYKPEFVSNDFRQGRKVLSSVEHELQACSEFYISVAFITLSGITPLLQTLKELEDRGIPGKILTTDYLNFSEPSALRKLHSLKNLELRMYRTEQSEGFHTKGYIFRDARDPVYRIIVGSSNMTLSALTQNKEWNTRIVSTEQGEYARQILQEFRGLWDAEQTKPYEDFIADYETAYRISKQQRTVARQAVANSRTVDFEAYILKPNSMQREFIRGLNAIREEGKSRALLISATGTGKTYASAFAMREENPSRVLFLVHREQIAKQAMASYRKIFGTAKTYGLLSGISKDHDTDYLFSTIQTMSEDKTLSSFRPDDFETIIIDEVHKAGAESYQKIMRYFRPRFWLGMTATPERTDGKDIYALFDHNIAYEIRLQQALEDNLLCPFHYFGITDLEVEGQTSDDAQLGTKALDLRQFNFLISDDRVRYILDKAAYYGHCGRRVKGLMFVSRREIGEELSHKFNEHGLKTVFLSGDVSQKEREEAIEGLTTDDPNAEKLDYILTVDIFNEGVDIPEVNQVILLRPTKSPIIYIQQLGRGLRKSEDKEFVVVLDFIGNYSNNYMIPIALSGDRTYNKDNMRRYVSNGARVIPGSSTIHFDEISRKRIYASIDRANVDDTKLIRENYENLKAKLGRIPALEDFDSYGEMDVLHIFRKFGSYYAFLKKYDKKDYTVELSNHEAHILEFVSCKFADGKRAQELLLLKAALQLTQNREHSTTEPLCQDLFTAYHDLETEYHLALSEAADRSVISLLTNEFPAGSGKKTYSDCVLIRQQEDGSYTLSDAFRQVLTNGEFRTLLSEVVDFGLSRYRRDYSSPYSDTSLVLNQKYTYEDVCRLLNWSHNEVPLNIGGYKYDAETKTFPVFVNYDKDENVAATQRYEDHFTSPDELVAVSKSGRSIRSEDVQNFLHSRERGIAVHLFVRKNKDDKASKEFYYLGRLYPAGDPAGMPEEFVLPGTAKTAVNIHWKLEVPVRDDIFEYITEESV